MYKNRNMLYTICFMIFIDSIGEGLVFPILPDLFMNEKSGFMLDNINLSKELLYSMSFTLFSFGSIFGMPILGNLSDKYGKSNVIIYGLGGIVLSYLFSISAVFYKNVWLFLFSRFIGGFLTGTYAVGNAVISKISDNVDDRISNFKLPTFASITGFIIGPALSICVVQQTVINPLIIPFLITFVLSIINLIFLIKNTQNVQTNHYNISSLYNVIPLYKSDFNYTHKSHNKLYVNKLTQILLFIYASLSYLVERKHTRILVLSYLFLELGFGIYFQSLSLFLATVFAYNSSQIGVLFIVLALVMSISMYILHPLVTKFLYYKTFIKFGVIVLSLLIVLLLVYSKYIPHQLYEYEYLTWIILVIFYIVLPFVTLGFTTLFASHVSIEEQGKIMGAEGQIRSFALVISGLLMSKLITINHDLVLLVSSIFLIVSYLVLRVYLRYK